MANLRLLDYQVIDSRSIKLTFTEPLDSIVSKDNITITSLTNGVPDVTTTGINIKNQILYVYTSPLTPQAAYRMTLESINQHPFKSIYGSMLVEDGTTNAPIILGARDPANFLYDRMISYLKDTPYDTETGLVRSYIDNVSTQFLKAYNNIRQCKTDNYLSVTVIDELHKRGKGPYDRLYNEGAYEIIRVGKNTTGTTNSGTIDFTYFPSEPVSLQQEVVTNERLFFGAKNTAGTFNESTCTLNNSVVIKITKIFIQYQDGSSATYDINSYGYQINSSRYDSRASAYVLLEDNQFRLSEKAISLGFRVPSPGDNVLVDYVYKKLGRTIDENEISVYSTYRSVRQPCLPLMTSFSLGHAPICNEYGDEITINGVDFMDPLAVPPFSQKHPAFQNEVAYDGTTLPTHPGEYSIDYANGKVYVYGVDSGENVGTSMFPPAATYYYRQYYSSGLDYSFDSSTNDLAANPLRELIGKLAVITYNYSDDLIPEVDYKPQVHKEELAERAQNRVIGNGAVQTLYTPITNAFRIYNETSGEVYGINRFTDNTIYFTYRVPPMFASLTNERVQFEQISGETLVKSDELLNSLGLRIFKFQLGTTIISSTDDSVGSSISTSVYLTDTTTFQTEVYYIGSNDTANINRLDTIGQYVINYNTGTIWLAVSGTQIDDVGGISYRTKNIVTSFPHITAVNQVYSSIDGVITKYTVNSFTDTTIDLVSYPKSDNLATLLAGDTIVLSEEISAVRHIYDAAAIINNAPNPIDFGVGTTFSYNIVITTPVDYTKTVTVEPDGYTIVLSDLIYTDSRASINSVVSIQRISDGYETYYTPMSNGSFGINNITLPTDKTVSDGESVLVRVKLTLITNSDVIVDYNRGEMFVDYIYCNDELIISYEHGDNCIDFRDVSTEVSENSIYYVSYKYGALRDALFANFGTLVDIDILHNFNVDLNRERYRDALMACLQTFPKGPQVQAISNIAKIISHADPIIWESFNDEWIVGLGHLYNNDATLSGPLETVPGKFNYAVRVTDPSDAILMPFSSHIKIEHGTLEMFVTPNWKGIDNDATITLTISRDGVIVPEDHIWIGVTGIHPTLDHTNSFTIIKEDDTYGLPTNIASGDPLSWGAYIYFDVYENNWKVLFKDVNATVLFAHNYQATIQTNGEFYNVKPYYDTLDVGDIITTTLKTVTTNMTIDTVEYDGYNLDGYAPAPFSFDGIKFMSDREHYFFDYLADPAKPNENRISILKDGRGYLVFKVISKKDVNGKSHIYQVSKDISDWANGDIHFIATSWRIASKDKRDEIHLFVDNEEVPNILRYGGRPIASATDRFRTVVPEILTDPVPKNTLTNIDLIITDGSDIVVSDNSDFGIAGIAVGDIMYIDNPVVVGPGVDGYFTILEIVTGNSVRLDNVFSFDMTDVGFTVNPWRTPVSTKVIYESNIAVSIIQPGGAEIEIPGLRATVPSYSVDVDTYGQPYLVLRGNVNAGDRIAIRTLGLNHRRVRERIYNWGTIANRINTFLPPPINLDHVKILPVLLSRTSISSSIINYLPEMQPSSNEGRTLELYVGNVSNCNFTAQPIQITIDGYTYSGATSEIITATAAGYYQTTEQFTTISNIACSEIVYNPALTAFSLEIREANSITVQENDGYFAILRYSYKDANLINLSGSGTTITSTTAVFDSIHVGYAISMLTPAIDTYIIESVNSAYEVTVNKAISAPFSGGTADLYNISIARSGYANGQFTLEMAGLAGVPYYLKQGYYDFDYSTYLDIPFEIKETNFSLGSNESGTNQANAVLEEVRALDVLSTDTRVGETLEENERSITSDSNTVKAFTADERTLLLMHFDEKPFIDSSIVYESYSGDYFQADEGVNSNFENSISISDKPLIIDNTNILFNNEGTIEFWVSPNFDTANDPMYRMYFDAVSSCFETLTALTRRDLYLTSSAKYIISITAPGFPEINYADGSTLATDGKTIRLGRELPQNNMTLNVIYIPFRGNGDRISIYKSPANTINFDITASGKLYSLSTPAFWPRNTWHRITAMWKCNTKTGQDEMHLLVDGVAKNKIIFGLGLNFSTNYKFTQLMTSSSPIVRTTINLREIFNKLFIGGNSFGGQIGHVRIDNLKISQKMKQLATIAGQQIDNDYSSNITTALPVIEDVYTTFLMDFNRTETKLEDFAILKNQVSGIFDFELDVIDSFSIIEDNPKSEEILDTLVEKLKPAVSRAFIKYAR